MIRMINLLYQGKISQMNNQNQSNENWLPLESNPQAINPFISKMGLKTDLFPLQEMLALEQWALEMIPKPTLETPVQEQFKNQQSSSLKPEQTPQNLFFMKQYAKNACGTIALFHMILNALEKYPEAVTEGSYLHKFKQDSGNLSAEKIGEAFKENKEILTEHQQAVSSGQSSVASECNSHFIAFIPKNGRLYELDGCKKCPVDHGACTEEEFLTKGAQIIQGFMNRDPDNINFSMIVLAKNPDLQ